MRPLIQAKNLSKTYLNAGRSATVLENVNLKVERGEFIALTGSSGSGKTTLMHLFGCLDRPSGGELILDGENISQTSISKLASLRNRLIGFVFQNFHLLCDLTAEENVMLPQLYGGIKEALARQRARHLLDLVGLGHRVTNRPDEMSGGQKQRLAIARALSMDPALLLADEPTGNLDSQNAERIMDLFYAINRTQKTTVILVTHEPNIAKKAPRCILVNDGRIISDELQ